MSEQPRPFWRGPVQSIEHAKKVTGLTAGAFAVFAGVCALTLFSNPDLGKVITVLVLGVPALGLLRTRSLIAARVLLGLALFCVATGVVMMLYELLSERSPFLAVGMLALALFWTPFVIAASRACKAAKYLRSAPEPVVIAAT